MHHFWIRLHPDDILLFMRLDWSSLRVRINTVGRVRCEPGWRLDRPWSRRLRDLDLWYVWAGAGSMTIGGAIEQGGGEHVALRPGVCVWMRPGRVYLGQQDPERRLGVTFVHFDLLDPADRPTVAHADLPAEVHEVEDAGYGDAVLRRVVELSRDHDQPAAARHLLTGVLMDLDAAAAGELRGAVRGDVGTAGHHRRLMLAAAAHIRESPSEAPSIADLAAQAGYSIDHFSRVFRSVLGQSPQDFIVQARIDRARQLLAESNLTVSQIADVLGYRDVYFFSRQFKQRTGRSPMEHRRRT